jgi:hypothetical protein
MNAWCGSSAHLVILPLEEQFEYSGLFWILPIEWDNARCCPMLSNCTCSY